MCKPKVKVTRRQFLQQCAAGFGALAAGQLNPASSILPSTAHAAQGTNLLVCFMDGGWDEPFLVQPNESFYAGVRPTLYENPGSRLSATSKYSIQSNLTSLKSLWDDGDFAHFKNVGYINPSRSHADSTRTVVRGVASGESNLSSGWLSRLGAQNFSNIFDLFSLAGDAEAVQGEFNGTAVRSLSRFNWLNNSSADKFTRDMIAQLLNDYKLKNGSSASTKKAYELAFNAESSIKDALASASFPGGAMSTGGFEGQLRDAFIAFTKLNCCAAYTELGGFDTHSGQSGSMGRGARLATSINNGLSKFVANCKAAGIWNNTYILFISEFGRTRRENGSQGTDHGNSGSVWLCGGRVKGEFYGGDYVAADFSNNLVDPRLNFLDIYRPLVAKLGYDPDKIFETNYPGQNTLNPFV